VSLALRLGARTLRRAPRRSLLTAAAGAGGLAVAVLLVNLAHGMAEQAVASAVRIGPGHLAVHRAGYLPFGDDARAIEGAGALARRIAALPGVGAALPRLTAAGLARAGAATRAVVLLGVDPALEAADSPLAGRLSEGSFLEPGAPEQVLLGAALSRDLAVRVGDLVRLSVPGSGAGGERALRVCGILDAGLDEIAPGTLWLPLPLAQQLAGRPDTAHEIAVLLHSSSPAALSAARAAIAALAAAAGDLEVVTWQQALPQLRDALALDALARQILILGLFGIVAIGAAAALLAAVLGRTRELGLLLALGTPPALLRRMVLAEGALLGLCAAALGLAAGAAATAVLARVGLDVRPLLGEEIAYGGALFSLRIHPAWDWLQVARAVLLVLGVYLAAAAWPAWRAGAVAPAEAMRFR
jgi:ABC-type lipoprotein release transport system permease subunit